MALGDTDFRLGVGAFGKYRFRLEHEFGLVGVSPGGHLPAIRVQPRAELIHGVGPAAGLEWFTSRCEEAFGGIEWSPNRVDLFCDVQGWQLSGDDRDRFAFRGRTLATLEAPTQLTGFRFGSRGTDTVSARIYDKTREIAAKGHDYWFEVWGDLYDASLPVFRVEFEVRRKGLTEFGILSPTQAISEAGRLWAHLTESWLTFRKRTLDQTSSRWPIAVEWESIQNAGLRGDSVGLERVRASSRAGRLRVITPALIGYFARMAYLTGTSTLEEALGALRLVVLKDEEDRGVQFGERIEGMRQEVRFS